MNWDFIHNLQWIYKFLEAQEKHELERDYPITWERVHATSCAQIGRMLAEIRGVDTEKAALACALHDIGRWVTGKQLNHAPQGEEAVRQFLTTKNYPEATIEQITQAVINHSRKDQIGSPLEELVKDADLLDCYWHGHDIQKPLHLARLRKVLNDLGISRLNEGITS